jgi:hypothetical protein
MRLIHEYSYSGMKNSANRNRRVEMEFSAAMESMSA